MVESRSQLELQLGSLSREVEMLPHKPACNHALLVSLARIDFYLVTSLRN